MHPFNEHEHLKDVKMSFCCVVSVLWLHGGLAIGEVVLVDKTTALPTVHLLVLLGPIALVVLAGKPAP